MSSNKHFLRISDSWLNIFTPSGNTRYMNNASGVTIRLLISDTDIDPTTIVDDEVHYFTVGGSIGTICANNDKYVYARAVANSVTTHGILVCDTETITNDDLEAVREEVETISVEIMRLMHRVSKQERKTIDHGVDYELFVREFLDTTARHHIQFSAIHKHIATIWEELLMAERFIQNHRNEYTELKEMVDNIRNINNDKISAELSLVKADVTSLLTNHANTVNAINVLQQQLATTDGKYDTLLNGEISPLRSQLLNLTGNLAALNNSLVLFVDKYNETDLNNAFDAFILAAPPSMVSTITAVKDYTLRLIAEENKASGGINPDDVYVLQPDDTTMQELRN